MSTLLRSLLLCLTLLFCLLTAACGYTIRGQQDAIPADSILGDGTKTLKIQSVDQTTLYSWLPYMVRSALRDGITERGLARWTDDTPDYTISANLTSCFISNENNASGASQLFTVSIVMQFIVRDGRSNVELWNSGAIAYSDSFQFESENEAVRQVVNECVRMGLDKLQQRF